MNDAICNASSGLGPESWRSKSLSDATALTDAESSRFATEGWVGPYPLLSAQGVRRITAIREKVKHLFVPASQMSHKHHWFKSMHAHVPEFQHIACHPAIVNRIKSVLGPDVMVWGQCITIRKPGQVHRWHVDVEHRRWPGVSVFLGLKGTSQKSTLKIISGSHKFNASPQELKIKNDEDAIGKAQEFLPSSRLISVDLKEGEFFIFDGPLWHGSHNSDNQNRLAMIIHYSQPSAPTQIPLNWDDPIIWSPVQPPCVLVAGADHYGINRLMSGTQRAL